MGEDFPAVTSGNGIDVEDGEVNTGGSSSSQVSWWSRKKAENK
jgi:hypothetical protein